MAIALKLGGAVVAVAAVVLVYNLLGPTLMDTTSTTTLTIGSAVVVADRADTPALRERGLSGRASLAEGQGMWFVFEEDDLWAFWMKDMHFAIDIIWADAEGVVLTIAHDVPPESYPKTFSPSAPARFVLEVPAGFARKQGIAEGQKIVVQ